MNVDLRGFSKMAMSMVPGEVMRVLAVYRRAVQKAVAAEGGLIDKFMGDGIMAVFADAGDHAEHAAAALRTAQNLLGDPAALSKDIHPLSFGIGIASGIVNWGAIGVDDRFEMTVIGPAANLSAKLEKQNKQLGTACLCSEETWQMAEAQGFEPAGMDVRSLTVDIEDLKVPVAVRVLAPRPVPIMHSDPVETQVQRSK